MKILILDDILPSQKVVEHRFKEQGYQDITAFATGSQVLEALNKDDYHLLFVSRDLAQEDAMEFLANLRQHPKGRRLAVALIALNENYDEKMKALMDFDIDFYLVKPITEQTMIYVFSKLNSSW
jgi:CheY-like chemotaxis protein